MTVPNSEKQSHSSHNPLHSTTESEQHNVSEPIVLAIDTSSRHGSIAVIRGGHPLAIYGADSQDTHSTRLISEIDMILTKIRIQLSDITAFAVVTGPGSFTGLRIGISTIK